MEKKSTNLMPDQESVTKVYHSIKNIIEEARKKSYQAVNFAMVKAYWDIGRVIVEEEQQGKARADYGSYLIKELSKKLSRNLGKGFDISNLKNMRQFYLVFPKSDALRRQLSWTHYRLLMRVDTKDARDFYMVEAINNKWGTRELERQIHSLLFERLTLSKDKKKILELSQEGQVIKDGKDIIKDPYVLEFLGLKENKDYMEKDLEQAMIDKLRNFLMELGKGFSFVARQKRITVGNDHFYIDLVFYNYIVKCFFLIDLKIGKLSHRDIGQMDFYVRYFEKEEKQKGDNPTIGLILCSEKNETMVKYTVLDDNDKIYASKYKLYIPSEEELKNELNKERELFELEKELNLN
jgi:predicted nuclease of restriction endonuclease-like (RecB) superfamily